MVDFSIILSRLYFLLFLSGVEILFPSNIVEIGYSCPFRLDFCRFAYCIFSGFVVYNLVRRSSQIHREEVAHIASVVQRRIPDTDLTGLVVNDLQNGNMVVEVLTPARMVHNAWWLHEYAGWLVL